MSDPRDQEKAQEIARLWQGSVVPVEDESVSSARRERIVEALGAAIRANAVLRTRDRSVRRAGGLLAVAAGLALAIGFGRQWHAGDGAARPAVVTAAEERTAVGTLTLVRGAQSSLVERTVLELGDRMAVADGAAADVRLGHLANVHLVGGSDLALQAPGAASHRLRLDRGSLHADVDDHPSPTPKLVVETPDVEVVVTGTVLEVSVERGPVQPESITTVSVAKGRVVVRRDGVDVAFVSAGEKWVSGELHQRAEAAADQNGATSAKKSAPAAHERGGTLAEENRLFQDAIDARNRGDDRAALERFSSLLAKFPGSPLAGEARIERMRAWKRAGDRKEAAREARHYLADFPGGFAQEEARRLVMQEESSP